jgi:hypothetical protein
MEDRPSVSRREIYSQAVHFGQIRTAISMLLSIPGLSIVGLIGQWAGEWAAVFAFFGQALIVPGVVERLVCVPNVECPHCGGSLWRCTTRNFKVRRLRLKPDIIACPHCDAAFAD